MNLDLEAAPAGHVILSELRKASAPPDRSCVMLPATCVTTVRIACPACGLVDVAIDHVTVLVTSRGSSTGYAFDCPHCVDQVEVAAGSRVAGMLYDIGARVALSGPIQILLDHEEQVRTFQVMLDRTDDIAGAIERNR